MTSAQTILIRFEAVSYSIDQVLRWFRKLPQLLAALSFNKLDRLEPIMESAIITAEALPSTVVLTQVEPAIGLRSDHPFIKIPPCLRDFVSGAKQISLFRGGNFHRWGQRCDKT